MDWMFNCIIVDSDILIFDMLLIGVIGCLGVNVEGNVEFEVVFEVVMLDFVY